MRQRFVVGQAHGDAARMHRRCVSERGFERRVAIAQNDQLRTARLCHAQQGRQRIDQQIKAFLRREAADDTEQRRAGLYRQAEFLLQGGLAQRLAVKRL